MPDPVRAYENEFPGTLFGKRIGKRVLICPECTAAIYDAGPGGAICYGDQREHLPIHMVAFVREAPDA